MIWATRVGASRFAGALAALVLWGAHSVDLALFGNPWDLLWMCNVAGPLVVLGWLKGSARLLSVAACWLTLGVPLWFLDVLAEGSRATSIGWHLGGLALAWAGVRRFGWPPQAALPAIGGLAGLVVLCWLVTPPEVNVNLVGSIWPGWEEWFPGHGAYLLFMGALGSAVFLVIDRAIVRVTR